MRRIFSLLTCAAMISTLSACSPQPPKCSDEQTTSLLLQIISDKLSEVAHQPKELVRQKLSIDLPVAVSMDEKVRRLNCEAMLKVSGGFQTYITFTSLVNDQDRHLVILSEISGDKALPLVVAVNAALTQPMVSHQAAASSSSNRPSSSSSNSSGLASLVGKHPGEAIDDSALNATLQSVLKDKFQSFADRMVVASSVEREGDFVFGNGCMPHSCGSEEAAYAANIKTGAAYAVIFSSDSIAVFGSTPSELPPPLRAWYKKHGGKD